MSASYTVKEAGYAFMYMSSEQAFQTDVYVDDVTMRYTPTNILQSNEYYPFGLQTAGSWTWDNNSNNFLYDAGNELNATSGFYDLPFRNYDAALGRFFQIDPLSYRDHNLTPYHYAGNNPIGNNDPSGLMVPYYAPGQDPRVHYRTDYEGNHLDFDGTWGDDYGTNGGGYFGGIIGGTQMQQDAAAVRSGAMSASAYGMLYGTNVYHSGPDPVTSDFVISIGVSGYYISNNYATPGDHGGSETIDGVTYHNLPPSVTVSTKFVPFASQGSGDSSEESNPVVNTFNGVMSIFGISVDATKDGLKAGAEELKGVKILSRGINVAVGVVALAQLGVKINDGTAKNSDYVRVAGAGAIIGSGFIPAAGPFISFGLGMADANGVFEDFYNSFDNPAMIVLYLNSLHP